MSLESLARDQLDAARGTSSGRGARTVIGGHGHVLRQTVIALLAGRSLAEHESPGEASLLVLHGRVRLTAGDASWEGVRGELQTVPPTTHRLDALDDAVVLLTVAKLSALGG